MKRARVIPVLLLQDQGLYKTIKFDNPKYIGDPINAIKIFNDKQCDELIVLDILASKERKEPDYSLIEEFATECFMPLAYGGGIKKLTEIERLIKLGVEKVILNSILLHEPDFLSFAINKFGSSTIVAAIDVKKNIFGKYIVYDHSTRLNASLDFKDYLKFLNDHDVGEIMVNAVDKDGMMNGYDNKLADFVSKSTSVPTIICGGAKDFKDINNIFSNAEISAAAGGSMFVYHGPHKAVLINYPSPEQISNISY
jgi:cyclase